MKRLLALIPIALLLAGCQTNDLCEYAPGLPWCPAVTNAPDPIPDPEPDPPPVHTGKVRYCWLRDKNASWRYYDRLLFSANERMKEMNLGGEAVPYEVYVAEIDKLRAEGFTGHIIFTYNIKDGVAFGGKTDIYQNGMGSPVDEAKLSALLRKIDYAARYMTIMLCPMPDDGGFDYDNMPRILGHYKVFVERIVSRYADNPARAPHGVVIMQSLEPEEYWNQGQFNQVGAYLNTLTDVEINAHGTKMHYQWAQSASWCDVINLQLDWRKSVSDLIKDVEKVIRSTDKPLDVLEATRGNATSSHRLGLRAELDKMDRVKGTP